VRECEKILKIEDADTYPEVNKDIVAFIMVRILMPTG